LSPWATYCMTVQMPETEEREPNVEEEEEERMRIRRIMKRRGGEDKKTKEGRREE
jgi:hypothetical protein